MCSWFPHPFMPHSFHAGDQREIRELLYVNKNYTLFKNKLFNSCTIYDKLIQNFFGGFSLDIASSFRWI